MSKKLITTQILLLVIFIHLNGIIAVKRDYKQNATISESTSSKERDARQYSTGHSSGYSGYSGGYPQGFGDYGLSSFGGPLEAVAIGLLVVVGIAVIGIPFLLLFMSLFTNNTGGLLGSGGIGGLNLVPTSTTSVTGRKKREVNSLLPEANPLVQQKLITIFENFIRSPDKIKLIEKLLDSMVARN